jgi:acetate kinase
MDQEIAKKFKLRKYGFHGVAVESALKKVEENFDKKKEKIPKKLIFAHLGGGSSITAVKNGKSLINSMGLTPISGLMMTTRIGDVDSDLDKILAQKIGKPLNVISDMFSRKSGFLGLTGSEDIKNIFEKAKKEKEEKYGNEKLAFDIYLNQVIQRIGSYHAILGGIDLLVFSGGIGEGNSFFRKEVLEKIEHLGINKKNTMAIKIDEEKLIFDKIKNL